MSLSIGTRVEVIGKGITGSVAFVGNTEFAEGKWIGIILDEPKGKNNGTLNGVKYFSCKENHGMFVRQTQLSILGEATIPAPSTPAASGIPAISKIPAPGESAIPSGIASGLPKPPGTGIPNIPKPVSGIETLATPDGKSQRPQTLPSKPRDAEAQDLENSAADFLSNRKASVTVPPSELLMPKTPSLSTSLSGAAAKKAFEAGPAASITSGASQSTVDDLIAKNRDLEEKLETLKIKRNEDRAKLIQLQQLTEFKNKMQIEHAEIQRQLQKTKNELKEVQESFEKYKEEMSTAADTIEMATLDKEMAEEKADQLQLENTELNERVVELEKQVNSMKEDLAAMASSAVSGTADSAVSGSNAAVLSYQLKQSEEQNAKLKEAVIRLRDLNKADRERIDGLEKALEQKEKLFEESLKDREKLLTDIENLEEARLALNDQVDAAMGATEMVEHLTQRNMELEDRVAALEDERHELEQLRDIDAQIQEEAKHVELQLREEADMLQSSRHEVLMKLNAANDQLADAESMLSRFRQLVASLREEISQLRSANADLIEQASYVQPQIHTAGSSESSKPLEPVPSAASRSSNAQLRSNQILFELSKIEASSLKRYIEMLLPFLPENWQQTKTSSSELTAVQTYISISRLMDKASMISLKVSEWFGDWSSVSDSGDAGPWTRQIVLQSSESQLINLSAVVTMFCAELGLHAGQLLALIDSLQPDHAISLLCSLSSDITRQEQSIDAFVEKLKTNQLDDTSNLDALCQPVETMRRIFDSQSGSAALEKLSWFGDSKLIADGFKLMETAAQLVLCASSQMSPLISSDLHIISTVGAVVNLKSSARTLLQASRRGHRLLANIEPGKQVTLEGTSRSQFLSACQLVVRICNVLRLTSASLVRLVASNDASSGADSKAVKKQAAVWQLTAEAFNECAAAACHSVFGAEDAGIAEHCRQLSDVTETVKTISAYLDPDGDIPAVKSQQQLSNAFQLRAAALRAEAAETRASRQKLETRDAEINDLKKAVRSSQDDKDQLNTKIGLLERRIEGAGRDTEAIQHKCEELKLQLVAQQNEAERTLDVYQRQIGQLQAEKQELVEKVMAMSRRPSGHASSAAPTSADAVVSSTSTHGHHSSQHQGPAATGETPSSISSAAVRDSPMLLARIADLEVALQQLVIERNRLRLKISMDRFSGLKPLRNPLRASAQGSSGQITELCREVQAVRQKAVKELCQPIRDASLEEGAMTGHKLKMLLSQRSLRLHALHDSLLAASSKIEERCPKLFESERCKLGSKILAEVDLNKEKQKGAERPVVSLNVTRYQFSQIHRAFLAS